jgi:hypothetical protein
MVRTTGQSDYGSEQDNRYELIILRINVLRNMFIFVSRYLKFLVSEEICGRFGSFDEQTTAYRLTRATSYEGVR